MERTKTFANRDVSNLIICDYNTGAPYISFDYANVSTADMTGEVVYAYGGQGHPKKVSFSGDRGGTMTIEAQVRESKLYKLISGAEPTVTSTDLRIAERVFTTAVNTFNLEHSPVIDQENESFDVYTAAGEAVLFTVEASDITEKTKADGVTKYYEVVITPSSDIAADTELVVYYYRNVAANKSETFRIKADTFPRAVIIYADTWDKATDDSIVEQKMIAYKAVAQPNFSLSNSNTGDPGTLTMTFDLMENSNHDIFDLIFKNRA